MEASYLTFPDVLKSNSSVAKTEGSQIALLDEVIFGEIWANRNKSRFKPNKRFVKSIKYHMKVLRILYP